MNGLSGGGVWREPKVAFSTGHLHGGESLVELLLCLCIAQSGCHHALVAAGPACRRGHAVRGRQLQRVDHAKDLVEISPRRRRVQEAQRQGFVRLDDEDCPAGHWLACGVLLFGVEHAIEDGDVSGWVADDGVGDGLAAAEVHALDVLDPALVGGGVVAGEGGHLDAAPVELALQLGHGAQLGGADGREVRRVAEENRPAPLDELVPLDWPGRAVGSEVWHRRPKPHRDARNASLQTLLIPPSYPARRSDRHETFPKVHSAPVCVLVPRRSFGALPL
mmetsp:Transcript_4561/g.11537  ORF Transcript_4561/g.11537 Transcript_4561/m.11537 type:complete len:277 (-) Transcript_4561:32-862(-)